MRAAIAGAVVLAVVLCGPGANAAPPSTGVALGALTAPLETVAHVPARTNEGRLDSRLSEVAAAPNNAVATARAEAAGITVDRGSLRVVVRGEPDQVVQALRAAG